MCCQVFLTIMFDVDFLLDAFVKLTAILQHLKLLKQDGLITCSPDNKIQ